MFTFNLHNGKHISFTKQFKDYFTLSMGRVYQTTFNLDAGTMATGGIPDINDTDEDAF